MADDTLDELRRNLYWARVADRRDRASTERVRNDLLESIAHLRDDERRYIPYDEPMLASPSRPKRRIKRMLFRGLRYMTWRYDRLLREQAALSVALADRVIALEAELATLRDRVDPPEEQP